MEGEMIKKAEMTGVFHSNITLKNTILFKLSEPTQSNTLMIIIPIDTS